MIEAPARTAPDRATRTRLGASAWAVGIALGSIALTWVVGKWLQAHGTRLFTGLPPLTGVWDLSLTWRAMPALVIGILTIRYGLGLARRVSWGTLLVLAGMASLAWSTSLAFTEGVGGLVGPPSAPSDYLASVPFVGAPHAFLLGFVPRIAAYSTHVRAHPPGFVLLLWAMGRLGLTGAGWVALLELLVAASAVPAVLLVVREIADASVARRAAPFLAMLPAFSAATSGDAVFLGVSAWAVTALVLATAGGRRSGTLAAAGGAVFGVGLLLSYGLVLVAAVPTAVSASRRRVRPLAVAGLVTVAVLALASLAGFDWLAGLSATRREYARSIARFRPYAYFLFADLAALAAVLGPAVWAALPRVRDPRMWVLVGAGLAAVAVADLSGLSKAEVERIWLPFMPWIAVATGAAFTSEREERGWLAAQVGWAIALELSVRWPW
ncbi:MAG: hypothetical protein ACM3OO_00730 [Planctomycetaceae bacterium]